MRRLLLSLFLLFAVPVGAGAQPLRPAPFSAAPFTSAPFNPAADYVTAGQDEPGYQSWYKALGWRPVYVRAFNNYLVANGVGGIVPTWQLLRTASEWQRCGADPFEVPPTADWANIVETLRFIRAYIIPVLGPVEPVSVYRNPMLNVCAGGAETSTHREMGAVDIVPLRPITREALMVQLCAIHTAHPDSNNGLGFYKGLRFHIDARKYREWGTSGARGGYGCNAVLAEGAAPYNPGTPTVAREPLFVTLQPSVVPAPGTDEPPPPADVTSRGTIGGRRSIST
mgnify:CR=1 FL=1